ncbi:MAG: hypothetical protein J4G09_01150 [Proteobacteria bacterium]|nr:hypothetical protein [Pseudomonadota bacterium]
MRRLELSLFADEVTEVPSETVVVLVPTDERPLRGDAARIDWRLDGQLSELLRLGYASGESGEAVLVPADLPLYAYRVLMVGVGARRKLDIEEGRPLLRAMHSAVSRLISLRSSSGLIAACESVDYALDSVSLLRGLIDGLRLSPEDSVLRIRLPGAERIGKALRGALVELEQFAHEAEVEVVVRRNESELAALSG